MARNLHERSKIWSAPDPSEEPILRQEMAKKREEINAIDSQALELQAQSDAMKQRKLELTRLHALFSPIRRLLHDLLVEVFRHLNMATTLRIRRSSRWDPEDDTEYSRALWSRNDATPVSTVCWAWNTLLRSVAQFSTTFSFDVECLPGTVLHPELLHTIQFKLRSTVLERSKSSPLTIHITAWNEWPYTDDILSPLFEEAHRWKKLVLIAPSNLFMDSNSGLQRLGGSFPTLESLRFEDIDKPRRDGRRATGWFSDAPCLREVVYGGTRLEMFDIPWRQVQVLSGRSLYDTPTETHVRILASAVSLRRLEYKGIVIKPAIQGEKISLPITSLEVRNEDLDLFRTSFELPSLTELNIVNLRGSISSFLSQVALTLQRLEITIMGSEPFPLSFLGSETYFPQLVELLVVSLECPLKDTPEDPSESLLRTRCPRLARFECTLKADAPVAVRAWAYLFSEFGELPGEGRQAIKTCFRVRGPFSKRSPLIGTFRDLISRGTSIELHFIGRAECTWTLDATDVENSDLFVSKQNLLLGWKSAT